MLRDMEYVYAVYQELSFSKAAVYYAARIEQ